MRNWSPFADFCHSTGILSCDRESGRAGKCLLLRAVDCPVTPCLQACSERLENRMLRACCEIVSSLTHRNFLPRLLLVKSVGTSIFNHIKKEENQNKISTKVKKNRSFITKVISTYFLLTLYRLINHVD